MVNTTSVDVAIGSISPINLYPTTLGSTIDMDWSSMTASASIPPTPDKEQEKGKEVYMYNVYN